MRYLASDDEQTQILRKHARKSQNTKYLGIKNDAESVSVSILILILSDVPVIGEARIERKVTNEQYSI